jgi:gamma-glutamylcyclotransferase (GGCT)/AIG2-like uncharacterized protein YtfP
MRYFAYGSNIDERSMRKIVPHARVLGPGRLDGYRLEFNVYSERWDGGAANLEPQPEGRVWGLLWDIPDEDLEALDTYAGHPTFYRREDVEVHLGEEVVPCTTLRVAHQKGYIRPSDRYINTVRSAMRVQGLPPEALDMWEQAALPPRPRI